jgi:hypothetical protein
MENLVKMMDHVESKGFQLEKPEQFLEAVEQFSCHYGALARLSMESGELLFSVTPKFHFLHHLADQALHEHPRIYWNYSGETFVGQIASIGHMCIPGKPIHDVTRKLCERYRIAFCLRLERDFGRD